MKYHFPITLVLMLLFTIPVAYGFQFERNEYWDNKQYSFQFDDLILKIAGNWDKILQENPPLSTKRAIDIGSSFITELSPEPPYKWKFRYISLENPYSDYWIWVMHWQLTMDGPTTGNWPTMSCYILMNGNIIKPVITIQSNAAQQVDAPGPATMADSASQTPKRPAR